MLEENSNLRTKHEWMHFIVDAMTPEECAAVLPKFRALWLSSVAASAAATAATSAATRSRARRATFRVIEGGAPGQ